MDGSPGTLSVEEDGVQGKGPSTDGIAVDDLSRSSSSSTFIVHAEKNTLITSADVEELRGVLRAVL